MTTGTGNATMTGTGVGTGAGLLRGMHLHIDCPAGAAGDMMLGALIDLGVPVDVIGVALDAIGAGRHRLKVQRVVKHGIASVDVKVDTAGHILDEHKHGAPRQPHSHAPHGTPSHSHPPPSTPPPIPSVRHAHDTRQPHSHDGRVKSETASSASGKFVAIKFRAETNTRHITVDELGDKTEAIEEHGHGDGGHTHGNGGHGNGGHAHGNGGHSHGAGGGHAHYHYADIRSRITRAPLTEGTRGRALDIFDRLARAEAKLHGSTVDEVTFHEVGAIDSIVDVVGTAAALDWLSPASVTCASVAMGHGTLTCAHGVLPVPAPAALEVLREAGGIMADGDAATELCTPTGAAILASTVTRWTSAPMARPVAVGWGAGDNDLADRANVLRLVVMALAASGAENVWQIDANIDDMSPELTGAATDALFAAGALDVWWTPITMKKGRPALTLSALAETARREDVINAMLRETTTIGVRYAELHRTVLERRIVEVETRFGRVALKVALQGNVVVNVAPEYEACAAAARAHGVPVKVVFAAAMAAYDGRI